MKFKIIESKGSTFYLKGRGIPTGCKHCLNGTKTVLFLNGICQTPSHCYWYCPISNERRGKSITYANEVEINGTKELLQEVNLMDARGMSITGGEPLLPANLPKCLEYIQYMKKEKGPKFHVHLYTNGINFTKSVAKLLSQAGLDEIRFHPSPTQWSNIKLALGMNMDVGVEIPLIPEQDYLEKAEKLILFLSDIGANFINLNEFEYCFPNSAELKKRGFHLEKNSIASVEHSRKWAFELIQKMAPQVSMKMHFCTIYSKDYWQLKQRYQRRAKGVKQPHEFITPEGLLMYAQIEASNDHMKEIAYFLTNSLKISPIKIGIHGNIVTFPLEKIKDKRLIPFLEKNNYACYILETLPFKTKRDEYITEKTPLNVFLEERGI